MWRWRISFVLLIAATIAESQDHAKVSLVLPSGTASETARINYFLIGQFGGYGSFVKSEKNRTAYQIEPFVDGQPAKQVKVVAYLPGCEFIKLELPFEGMPVERKLDCYPLGSILLRGRVSPALVLKARQAEVEVSYLAVWANRFFGIADGPVTTVRLASVPPNKDGEFEVNLPDLYGQSILRDGGLEFILRDAKTGNILAFLTPAAGTSSDPRTLDLQTSYPLVELVADLRQDKPSQ